VTFNWNNQGHININERLLCADISGAHILLSVAYRHSVTAGGSMKTGFAHLEPFSDSKHRIDQYMVLFGRFKRVRVIM
jgi:hypothetical protein